MSSTLQFEGLARTVLPARPLHLAIGMFDGVHLGHRAVVEPAVHSARSSGGISAVLTFWPHPSTVLRPDRPTPLITDAATKVRILLGLGVEAVITEPFTKELAQIEAEAFLPYLRERLPHLTAVYVGENWRFGRGRRGDVSVLVTSGSRLGVEIFSVPRVNLDGQPVSSTRIRQLLLAGELAEANAVLGYTYFCSGTVVPGRKLGRTIGFPTLNLDWNPGLKPRFGVYAVRVSGRGASAVPGVANYGMRPTVGETPVPLLEIHVLAPCPFGDGDAITVEWLSFLRAEEKFSDLEALRKQIARDAEAAHAVLAET